MLTISIATTVKILVTEEAAKEEKSSMGAIVAADNKVTRVLIVGTTYRILAKVHHGIRNMEVTVRKLDWQELKMLNYYCSKKLPNIAKVKAKKIMALNIYRKLICSKHISFNSHRKLKCLRTPMYLFQTMEQVWVVLYTCNY